MPQKGRIQLLFVLEKSDPIYMKLNNNFMKVCKNPPNSLNLTEAEKGKLNNFKEMFMKNIIDNTTQEFMLKKFNAKDWSAGIQALFYYQSSKLWTQYSSQKIWSDLSRMIVLCLTSEVSRSIQFKEVEKALSFVKMIAQLCIFHFEKGDPHQLTSSKYLNLIFSEAFKLFSEEQKTIFTEIIEDVAKYNQQSRFAPTPEAPEELKLLLASKTDPKLAFSWTEPWKSSDSFFPIHELLQSFIRSKESWLKLHHNIMKSKNEINEKDFYEVELKEEIDFRKGLNQQTSHPTYSL